jgi:hypothetical protein
MAVYEVELEPAGPDGFAAMVPAVPGLFVLGSDVDEVLRRVRAAMASCEGCGLLPIRLAIRRTDRGELLPQPPTLRRGQRDLQPRERVGGGPRRVHQDAARRIRCARVAPPLFRARGTPRGLPPRPFPRWPIGAPCPSGTPCCARTGKGVWAVLRAAYRGVIVDKAQDLRSMG